jgi:cytochrome b subunit of formate dehydrogenase
MSERQKPRGYLRFGVLQRIEHVVLILSFSTLAVTGLVQLFPAGRFSHWFVFLIGGIWIDRIVHRTAAVILVLQVIIHALLVGYRVFVLRVRMTMLPGIDDVRAAWSMFLYNLGLRKERPHEGRYSFVEKAEYWALIWGVMVMAITGFMLWNPVTVTRVLPGRILPAAELAHGAEAVLAVAAVIVWHFYHSHIKVFNKSIFIGRITEREMADEHPAELARIKTGPALPQPAPEDIVRRRRIYLPIGITAAVLLIMGLYLATIVDQTFTTNPPPLEPGQALIESQDSQSDDLSAGFTWPVAPWFGPREGPQSWP